MPGTAESENLLKQTWQPARGFPGVLSEVNNQIIGMRFMITAFVFFLLGGILALLMRIQLAVSHNDFMGPDVYNELFTMHGSTMMFLFAVPFLEGLALYLLPMMLGARDVAFPRLTAYGYWVYLFGGLVFYASFFFGAVPDVGWFGYTPYSTAKFTGIATDYWLLGLSLVEVAGLTAGLEIVVTILKFRAPGMTLGRMPLFVWAMLVVGIMILIAFTVLLTATVLLELDRTMETCFFDVERGGNNLLWQHLFWFFGHPEVYIMFLPATGIVSMVIPTFAQRPVAGYALIAVAIVVTGFVSFGLWVHHMFAAGLPGLAMTFFTASSLMIAIASGVQVFAWIATLWGSGPAMKVPLLFALGFVFLFVLGGLTGVMVAVVPFDLQVHDTYFIVAHFHYVLIGGVLFPIFAGLYYWIPKMSGRMLNPTLGQVSFWLSFIGFNITFFPMHIMGFLGLPRRVYTYPRTLELDGYNLLATAGAFMLGLGVLAFLIDVIWALAVGPKAGDNPWNSDSLEWSVASTPPVYTFAAFPIVHGRHPLWETETAPDADLERLREALWCEPQSWRGTLVTDATDARPQAIQYLSGPTYLPLGAAVSTAIAAVGVLSRAYIMAGFGVLLLAVFAILWLAPRSAKLQLLRESDLPEKTGLPVEATGTQATPWWGMLCLITICGSAFIALFYSYFYIRLFSPEWPQGGIARPDLRIPAVAYGLLIVSGLMHAWGMRKFHCEVWTPARVGLIGALLLGVAFLGIQVFELLQLTFTPKTNAYASLFHVILWSLMLSTVVSLGLGFAAQWRFKRTYEAHRANLTLHLELTSLLWYFTIVAGLLVFATLYLSPYLL